MTDSIDPRDATIVGYLRQRTPGDAPADLASRVMSVVDATPQTASAYRFSVPMAVAGAAAAIVVVAVALNWYAGLVGSGPGPVESGILTASASTAPSPSAAPSTLPSVPGLVAGPATCTNEPSGYTLMVTAGWYANLAASEVETPSCLFLATEAFEAPRTDSVPPEARIILSARTGDYSPGGRVEARRDLTINGMPALRLEIVGEPGGTLPAGHSGVVYVIGLQGEMPSESTTRTWLLIETGSDRPGSGAENIAALDAIARTVEALP